MIPAASSVLTAPTVLALWYELVHEAIARSSQAVSETQEQHLVFVLQRHLRSADLESRAMSALYLESLGRAGADGLGDAGDRCLILAGLFPDRITRHLPLGYVMGLGSSAYHQAAARARPAWAEWYAHLGHAFVRLVRVLAHVRSDALDAWFPFNRHDLAAATGLGSGASAPFAVAAPFSRPH